MEENHSNNLENEHSERNDGSNNQFLAVKDEYENIGVKSDVGRDKLLKQSSTIVQVDPIDLSISDALGYRSPTKSPFRARVYKEEEEKGLYEVLHHQSNNDEEEKSEVLQISPEVNPVKENIFDDEKQFDTIINDNTLESEEIQNLKENKNNLQQENPDFISNSKNEVNSCETSSENENQIEENISVEAINTYQKINTSESKNTQENNINSDSCNQLQSTGLNESKDNSNNETIQPEVVEEINEEELDHPKEHINIDPPIGETYSINDSSEEEKYEEIVDPDGIVHIVTPHSPESHDLHHIKHHTHPEVRNDSNLSIPEIHSKRDSEAKLDSHLSQFSLKNHEEIKATENMHEIIAQTSDEPPALLSSKEELHQETTNEVNQETLISESKTEETKIQNISNPNDDNSEVEDVIPQNVDQPNEQPDQSAPEFTVSDENEFDQTNNELLKLLEESEVLKSEGNSIFKESSTEENLLRAKEKYIQSFDVLQHKAEEFNSNDGVRELFIDANKTSLMNAGMMCLKLKEYLQALELLEMAKKFFTDNEDCSKLNYRIGACYNGLGKYKLAYEVLESLKDSDDYLIKKEYNISKGMVEKSKKDHEKQKETISMMFNDNMYREESKTNEIIADQKEGENIEKKNNSKIQTNSNRTYIKYAINAFTILVTAASLYYKS